MKRLIALVALLAAAGPVQAVVVNVGNPWIPSTGVGGSSAAALDVPANVEVRLAPGGNYLVLTAVKRGFGNGDYVPVTLRFEDAKRISHTVDVNVEARGMTFKKPKPE